MKKKLFMSLFTIAITAALVTGGVTAYFSDTETSTGNTFTAGVIDIELSNLDPISSAFITILDIKPSQPQYGFFDIHGINGTNPGPVFIHITEVSTGQGEPSLSAEQAAEGENGEMHDIDNWMTISLTRVNKAPWGIPDDEMAAWLADSANGAEVIIDHDDHMKLSDLNSAIIPVGWISGESSRIWLVMDLHLQKETPNDYQGDTASFDVEVIMTQTGAPPPVQSGNKIILENKDPDGVDNIPGNADDWSPILGDGIWGIVQYNTSTLTLDIHAEGLPANTAMQVSLNSPEVADWFPGVTQTVYEKLASALGANAYQSPPASTYPVNFVRGYWDSNSPNLNGTYVADDIGIYNIAQGAGHVSDYGGYDAAPVTTAGGELDDTITTSGLPSGDYMWIKVIIKEDGGSYATYLMEKTFGLFFTLP